MQQALIQQAITDCQDNIRPTFVQIPDHQDLDQAPDIRIGLATWARKLNAGASVPTIVADLTGSQEFMSLYGDMNDSAFVQALYRNTLHRGADVAGLANWTGQLAAGASRASVIVGFADSPENRILTADATHDGVVFMRG